MVDFTRTLQNVQQPIPKKLLVVESYNQYSLNQFIAQRDAGGISREIDFAPPDLDLLRFMTHRQWDDDGLFSYAGQFDYISVDSCIIDATGNPSREEETKEILTLSQGYGGSGIVNLEAWAYKIDSTQPLQPNLPEFHDPRVASMFGSRNGVRGKTFFDHTFEMEMPFPKKEVDKRLFGISTPPTAEVKSIYNFYVDSYEGVIAEDFVDERTIPNMYAFLLVLQETDPEDVIVRGDDSTIDDIFERHITLQQTVKDTLYASDANGSALTREVINRTPEQQLKKSSRNQYYDKYAKNYTAFRTLIDNNNAEAQQVESKFTNIIAPLTDIQLYRDFNDKKRNFPMGIDISFSTDTNTDFTQALKESKLSSTMIKDIISPTSDFKELSDLTQHQPMTWGNITSRPEWEVPQGAGLIVWIGKKSDDFFQKENGFVAYIPQSSVVNPLTRTTDRTLYLADRIDIINWDNLYVNRNPASWPRTAEATAPTDNLDYGVDVYLGNSSGAQVFSKGNPTTENFVKSQSGWGINIIGYWKTFQESSTTDSVNHFSHWEGFGYNFLETFHGNGNLGKAGRFARAQQYARKQRELSDIASSDFTLINLPSHTRVNEPLKQWDITGWVTSLASDPDRAFTPGDDDMVFLGEYNEEVEVISNSSTSTFYKTLMTIIMAGKLSKLMLEKTRTFNQILNGEKAYTETVFYQIEKWAVDSAGNYTRLIQSIYLPNSNEIDVHQYIDTQVKYGKRYRYKIHAYQAVFGTKYRYILDELEGVAGSQLQSTNNDWLAKICVFSSPSVRLIKTPYYEAVKMVMDAPPVWPDLDILSYRNQNDKVLFWFRGNVGNYKLKPIAIDEDDAADIQKLREAQDILDPHEPITFKSDDQAKIFEIFRMETRPVSYQQFAGKKIFEAHADAFEDPKKSATAASFIDYITPNKKYYYMFRTKDVHNHTSNPTAIYEVEMVDHDMANTLVTKMFPIKKEKDPPQVPSKSGKKYIYIKPSTNQLGINKEESKLVDSNGVNKNSVPPEVDNEGVMLGSSSEPVWGKKYKIRIVSKQSGKKIDFNVEFKTKPWRTTDQGLPNG